MQLFCDSAISGRGWEGRDLGEFEIEVQNKLT